MARRQRRRMTLEEIAEAMQEIATSIPTVQSEFYGGPLDGLRMPCPDEGMVFRWVDGSSLAHVYERTDGRSARVPWVYLGPVVDDDDE